MKHSILALIIIAFAFFASCCKDDEPAPTQANNNDVNVEVDPNPNVAGLANNAMLLGGDTVAMRCRLDVRPPLTLGPDDRGEYNLTALNADSSCVLRISYDATLPQSSIVVDLAHPDSVAANHDFGLEFMRFGGDSLAFGIELHHGYYRAYLGDSIFSHESCFRSGRLNTVHALSGYTLHLASVLRDGTPFALKLSVPEEAVEYR